MDRFLAIDAFVRVAETQSFAEAARQMRVSRSVLTARVQQLEEFVGATLFHRNTRSVRLSEFGQTFLRDCNEVVSRTNSLVDQMRDATTSPAGRLRVHALPGFVLGHLASLLNDFQTRYPELALELVVSDTVIDPVKEGFDCALQIFPPTSEEVISHRLFPVRRVFCASPAYLRQHGTPRHPHDLLGHRIGWYSGYPTREKLAFHGAGEQVMLAIKPLLLSNSVHLLREYAEAHAGIVCLPTLVASAPIVSGELQMVLPEYGLGSFWLSVYYSTSGRSSLKLKLFLQALSQSFSGVPQWDSMLIERGFIPAQAID